MADDQTVSFVESAVTATDRRLQDLYLAAIGNVFAFVGAGRALLTEEVKAATVIGEPVKPRQRVEAVVYQTNDGATSLTLYYVLGYTPVTLKRLRLTVLAHNYPDKELIRAALEVSSATDAMHFEDASDTPFLDRGDDTQMSGFTCTVIGVSEADYEAYRAALQRANADN